jgi:uncharacterized protein YyaL (SSP411 family)
LESSQWYSWSDEAFAKATAEDKPIFLSIDFSTCHWWQDRNKGIT